MEPAQKLKARHDAIYEAMWKQNATMSPLDPAYSSAPDIEKFKLEITSGSNLGNQMDFNARLQEVTAIEKKLNGAK